jgi:hypothetical protein
VEQKDLFGASAESLPYVECSPNGRTAPQAAVCVRERIESYPTWFIRGQRHTGVIKPDRLATLSGYKGKK